MIPAVAVARERRIRWGRPLTGTAVVRTARRLVSLSVVFLVMLLALGLLPWVRASPPRSNYALTVYIDEQDSPWIHFRFNLTSLAENKSDPARLAASMSVEAVVGPELYINGTEGNHRWSVAVQNVLGDIEFPMDALIAPSVQDAIRREPDKAVFATAYVNVTYTDRQDTHPRTIHWSQSIALNYRLPAEGLMLPGAALAGLGGAGLVGLALYVPRRSRVEELFLMHNSGMLIRHWSRHGAASRDSDIMSGMLIVLQEFVRDTFDRQGILDRLRFGNKQVVMARGQHAILAAVVIGRRLNGLPKKLQKAVEEFEGSHRDILPDWNGNVDLLPKADVIADRFLRGRARATT